LLKSKVGLFRLDVNALPYKICEKVLQISTDAKEGVQVIPYFALAVYKYIFYVLNRVSFVRLLFVHFAFYTIVYTECYKFQNVLHVMYAELYLV
jgi:hypothetical protein